MVPTIKELRILLEEMPQAHLKGQNTQGLGQRMALGSNKPSSTTSSSVTLGKPLHLLIPTSIL